MTKFRQVLEGVPAALLLVMALLTSLSATTRYFFNAPIPDEYEISRMLLSVVVCWGMAAAFYYRDHIYLDVFWGRFGPRAQRVLSRLGALLCLLLMGGYSVALALKVLDTMDGGIRTIDLGISVWGFQFAAWLGTLASVAILLKQALWPTAGEADEPHVDMAL